MSELGQRRISAGVSGVSRTHLGADIPQLAQHGRKGP
jgi:hypothetical protein